ncbi:MAG: RNA polymerase sigma factor [Saprospiraceae bacterium]|nr:RNA polymerase sigma factor [Bacteroidia bacterium]NNE15652.1 RNA polymerase sigma factor [Saprospiraceae bacterium]NNL92402.1 RNA polymerase sigma factor [Saprospiraceae bacterium]RZW38102.1 MAG: RNA polymerase sigma factor [Flavobacteriaceae bacterium]
MEITLNIQQSEKEFIGACINNEEWAQKKLYEDHYSLMYPLCLRYATDEDEALDILHEGYIKVFRHIGKYTIGTSLKAWIKRIMVNTAIDYYRKRSRRRVENIDDARSLKVVGADAVEELSAQEILKAMQKLSNAYRSVFNLYVIEGYSHREVAERLNISESTSRSNLVKARNKLKSILLSKGITYER